MSNGSSSRETKNQRREAAREQARVMREKQEKKSKRNKFLIQGGVAIGAIAVVTVIVLIVVNAIKPEGPGPLNMASDGIIVGAEGVAVPTPAIPAGGTPTATVPDPESDLLDIQVYVDYNCIHCADFENANGEYLTQILDDEVATVEIHPIGILGDYSLRASAAAACVANDSADDFYAVNNALLLNRYESGQAPVAMSNDDLKKFVEPYLTTNLQQVQDCIGAKTFRSWAESATERATGQTVPNTDGETVTGTPAIFVNGQKYTGNPADQGEFQTFVLAAAAVEEPTSTSTPEPTPSEAPTATPTPTP